MESDVCLLTVGVCWSESTRQLASQPIADLPTYLPTCLPYTLHASLMMMTGGGDDGSDVRFEALSNRLSNVCD